MEIKDLVEYEINESLQTLKVTFRLIQDNEDEVRIDSIVLSEVSQYGYSFLENSEKKFKELFEDDFDEEFDDEFADDDFLEESIDEQEIISFLTEYYILNPKKVPNTEFF